MHIWSSLRFPRIGRNDCIIYLIFISHFKVFTLFNKCQKCNIKNFALINMYMIYELYRIVFIYIYRVSHIYFTLYSCINLCYRSRTMRLNQHHQNKISLVWLVINFFMYILDLRLRLFYCFEQWWIHV